MSPYEAKGEIDAQAGVTVCNFHDPEQRRLWNRGHDRAVAAGLGPFPRFGLICRRAAPRPMDGGPLL